MKQHTHTCPRCHCPEPCSIYDCPVLKWDDTSLFCCACTDVMIAEALIAAKIANWEKLERDINGLEAAMYRVMNQCPF